MKTLDKIKLSVRTGAVKKINYGDLNEFSNTTCETGESKSFYGINHRKRPLGINYLKYDKNQFDIEISSKILKSRYKELINKDNIEYIMHIVNNTGIVELDTKIVLDEARVLNMHVTNDIKVSTDPSNYIMDLEKCCSAANFRTKDYNNSGLEFYPNSDSNKKRLIIYDKHKELLDHRLGITREISKYINLEDFENILRVESTFNDFETMQKYFQLPTDDVLLKNVLESDVPVVHNYFLDMLAPEIKPGTFPELLYNTENREDLFTILGAAKLFELCDHNEKLCLKILKAKPSRKISRSTRLSVKRLNNIRIGIDFHKCGRLKNDLSRINEIKDKLKAV